LLLQGRDKWYGGLLGIDGAIYGIPQNADAVLKIVPETLEVSLIGKGMFPLGGWKWHGGVACAFDGCIYGIPNHHDQCLRINPCGRGGQGEVALFGDAELIQGAGGSLRRNGKYKYEGAVVGPEGSIYCMPGDADRVLKIIPSKDLSQLPAVELIGKSFALERRCMNKWQNGFLARDGCIYAIPQKGEGVLKIDTASQDVCTICPDSGPLVGMDKWQGGAVAADGCMYCVPFMAKHVLKIGPQGFT